MPPIDDLYADSTSAFLTGSNQVNVPTPRATPSTGITSIASAVARGLGQGGASLFGAAADTASGLSQLYVDPDSLAGNPDALQAADQQVNAALAKARAGHLFESNIGTSAYDLADTLKADPTKTTAIDQLVQGAVSGLTQIVPAAVLGGPLAGAAVGGLSMGMQRAEELKRQGVDVGTRTAVGAVEGAAAGVGGVLPVAGGTLARTAGLVVAGGPGLAFLQSAAEKAILRNANYDGLADQIDPLDPVNLAAATLVPAVIGAGHMALSARAARVSGGATGDLTSMPVDVRKGLQYNDPAIDAYAVQAAQANGVPPSLMLALKNAGEKSNPTAVSPAGAAGVAQLMPENQAKFGVTDPHDPVQSLDGMAKYLAATMKQYDGNIQAVIADYNGGPRAAEAVLAGRAPPQAETAAYLGRVNDYLKDHGLDHLTFNPTPDQVDAALLARGQRVVDEANPLAADDVAGMQAHQSAFELAARQMGEGEMPDVSDLLGGARDDSLALAAFAERIDTASRESAGADLDPLAADASGATPGMGPFGPVHDQFRGDAQGAVARLMADQTGEATAALHHPDVGDIDLVWGKAPAGKSEGYGLAKLAAKHPEVLDDLQGFLSRLKKDDLRSGQNRVRLTDENGHAVVSLDWRGQAKKWLLTAYEKRAGRETTMDTPPVKPADDTASRRTGASILGEESPAGKSQSATAIESNLRNTAVENPDRPVSFDSENGQFSGPLSEALDRIDEEHAAALDKTKLYSVAANCFISTNWE